MITLNITRLMVRNPSPGQWPLAKPLSEEQFKQVEPMVRSTVNHAMGHRDCEKYTDAELIEILALSGMPVIFEPTPAELVLATAIYGAPWPANMYLSVWLTDQDEYDMACEWLDSTMELDEFDLNSDELTQRTFLTLVAAVEGAHIPKPKEL